MKIMFYSLAAAVAVFAIWSLVQGIQAYLAGDGFQLTAFAIAIIGAMLAGLWFKRARSL
jgi:hypothetical protein